MYNIEQHQTIEYNLNYFNLYFSVCIHTIQAREEEEKQIVPLAKTLYEKLLDINNNEKQAKGLEDFEVANLHTTEALYIVLRNLLSDKTYIDPRTEHEISLPWHIDSPDNYEEKENNNKRKFWVEAKFELMLKIMTYLESNERLLIILDNTDRNDYRALYYIYQAAKKEFAIQYKKLNTNPHINDKRIDTLAEYIYQRGSLYTKLSKKYNEHFSNNHKK